MSDLPHQKVQTRILMAVSQLLSQVGGVEQYLERLIAEHQKSGYDVWLLAGSLDKKSPQQYCVPEFWKMSHISKTFDEIAEINPKIFNLHYVPQCFSRMGLSFGLLLLLWKIRKKLSTHLLITFHEVYEPFIWSKPWRFFPAFMQRLQWGCLLLLTHRALFVSPNFCDRVKRYHPWAFSKVEFISIPSNIKLYEATEEREKKEVCSFFLKNSDEIILGTLSKTLHEGLQLKKLIDIAAALNEMGQKNKVYLLGAMTEAKPKQREEINRYGKQKAVNLIWSGPLPESELSYQMQRIDAYVLMHQEGVSPRNTSFMAALVHGLPIFSAASPQMMPYPEFNSVVNIIEPFTVVQVAQKIKAYFERSREERHQQSVKSLAFYDEHFSLKRHMDRLNQIYSKGQE